MVLKQSKLGSSLLPPIRLLIGLYGIETVYEAQEDFERISFNWTIWY